MAGYGNSRPGARDSHQTPNCFKCKHFFITWEHQRGYACRAMGFKSKQVPWRVVVRESGMPCLMFSPKPTPVKRS
jgi:hypothetical protein